MMIKPTFGRIFSQQPFSANLLSANRATKWSLILAVCFLAIETQVAFSSPIFQEAKKEQKKTEDGIHWEKNTDGVTFDQVKAKAKKQGKKIFLDFYTKWCGPCKRMDKEVFSKKEIGDYYNNRFVCFKVDAEVGEGKELAKKYKVAGFPTFVYTDSAGESLKRGTSIGYGDVPGMMEMAKVALGELKEVPWSWYEKQYESGNRELGFLKNYIRKRLQAKRMPPSVKLKKEVFLATKPEDRFKKGSDTYNYVRWSSIPGNFFYMQLIENKSHFPDLFESNAATQRFLYSVLMQTSYGMSDEEKEKVEETLKRDFPKGFEVAKKGSNIDKLRLQGKNDEYVKEYYQWVKENDLPKDFNPFAASVISRMKNLTPVYAKIGVAAFEKNIKESPNHFYSQVNYAYLLYKAGEKEKAKAHALKIKDLAESFKSSKKMAKYYQVFQVISEGKDPTEAMSKKR